MNGEKLFNLRELIKDYDVFNTSIGLTKNGHWIPGKVYSVDEIINDKVSIDGKISNISINLKEKE